MRSAIISVGTELITGQVVNTNAAYLSQELNDMGMDVLYHYTMGDDPEHLKRILGFAAEDCDLFLITGGLGPTEDDLTKEILCEFLGEKLVMDETVKSMIENYMNKIRVRKTQNNYKQAYVPEHGEVFINLNGTAPGFAVEKDGKIFICMPGVPREMKSMFQNSAKPYLMKLSDAYIVSRSIKIFGMGESLIETMLLDLIEGQTDPSIATYAKESEVEVRITSKRSSRQEAEEAVDKMTADVVAVMGDSAYSIDGEEIWDVTADRLMTEDVTLSLCETITGGRVSALLCRNTQCDAVLDKAVVLCGKGGETNDSPGDGVPADMLTLDSAFGNSLTLGEESAESLTSVLYGMTGSRMCVSVTGNIGEEEKEGAEPGTFFISLLFDGKKVTRRYFSSARDRNLLLEFISRCTLNMIRLVLEGKTPRESLQTTRQEK